jgi:fumarate reductase iron-sulfur subunit
MMNDRGSKSITLEILRYRPEEESEPVFQRYEVPFRRDWVILDALNYIKDDIDGTLSYRWSCRMGVCGSCGMMVNGTPVLTCATFVEKCLSHQDAGHTRPIRVEPLVNFPVIRDLIIDMSTFIRKLKRVKPWIVRKDEQPLSQGEYLQSPAQLSQYKQYSMCINCMLCYSACPIVGLEPGFVGPAVIALAQRYNFDNRDQGNHQRNEVLSEDDGIFECTLVGECSVVCPKNVDPAGAIQRYKVTSAADWWESLLLPWGSR